MALLSLRWTLASLFPTLLLCTPARGQSTSTEVRFREATEALRAGHLDEAGDKFASIARDIPTFAEAHLNLGLVREEQGRNEEAIASLQKAIALKPRLRGANLFLGIAYYRLNQLVQAIVAFRNETTIQPSDGNAWMWLGVAQLAAEHPEEAVAALDRADKLSPDNVDILYHRGRAHLLVSKKSYERMFKTNPDSWRVHQVLAQAYAESDRQVDAIAEYEAAIGLAPNQPGLHEELGTAYRNANKLEAAEAAFRREVEIDPHNVPAMYKLGTAQVELGNPAEGKASIEAALKENPKLRDAAYYVGRAEMQLGHDSAAVEALKRAVSGDSDPEIVQQAWYQLGIVYRRMHRTAEAQQAMATFQKLKDQEAEREQQLLQKKRGAQGSRDPSPAAAPTNP